MKLYHWTTKKNIESIMKNGLKTNATGFLYLTKFPKLWENLHKDGILLDVEIESHVNLTCFENEPNGEQILCWENISIKNIKINNTSMKLKMNKDIKQIENKQYLFEQTYEINGLEWTGEYLKELSFENNLYFDTIVFKKNDVDFYLQQLKKELIKQIGRKEDIDNIFKKIIFGEAKNE